MDFCLQGPSELSGIERCPYYRGVRKERFHCNNSLVIYVVINKFNYKL